MTKPGLHLAGEYDEPSTIDPLLRHMGIVNTLYDVGGFYDTFRSYGTRAEASTSWCLRCNAIASMQVVTLHPHNGFGVECEPSIHPWYQSSVRLRVPWCTKCEDPEPETNGCYHINRLGQIIDVRVETRNVSITRSNPAL